MENFPFNHTINLDLYFFSHLLKKVRFSDKLNANKNEDAYTGCLGGFFDCLFVFKLILAHP